jgi:hypothetical protein
MQRLLAAFALLFAVSGCGNSGPSLSDLKARYDFERGKLDEIETRIDKCRRLWSAQSGLILQSQLQAAGNGGTPSTKQMDTARANAKATMESLRTEWKQQAEPTQAAMDAMESATGKTKHEPIREPDWGL